MVHVHGTLKANQVQGVQFQKGSDVVTHGDSKMPDGMYHVMLSRAVAFENVFNHIEHENYQTIEQNLMAWVS